MLVEKRHGPAACWYCPSVLSSRMDQLLRAVVMTLKC